METFDLDDFDDNSSQPQALDPNIRKQLREAEKMRRELEAVRQELETQQKENQITRAGIPDNGLGSLFRRAYDGPMDVESIRKAAEEYGILQPSREVPVADAELDALRRTQGATVGSSGARPDQGQEFMAQLREASSPEEVMRIVQGEAGQSLGLWASKGMY